MVEVGPRLVRGDRQGFQAFRHGEARPITSDSPRMLVSGYNVAARSTLGDQLVDHAAMPGA